MLVVTAVIYNCSYVGALCVPAMFQDVHVGRLRQDQDGREIKKGVKLKSLTLNNGTLAMVFRLVLNQEV